MKEPVLVDDHHLTSCTSLSSRSSLVGSGQTEEGGKNSWAEMEAFMGGSSFSYSASTTSSSCSNSATYHHQAKSHHFSNGTFPGVVGVGGSSGGGGGGSVEVETCCNLNRRESESYVAVKGRSLIITRSEGQKRGLCRRPSAVALNGPIAAQINMKSSCSSDDQSPDSQSESIANMDTEEMQTMSEIERHLHQMTQLLRPQDSIKLVVRLESSISSRIRYLAVVSCMEEEVEEYCLLGMDCNGDISLRLVLAILSHTIIRLDGDGGFCVQDGDGLRSHIFKPVSVQTMWSALQSLYRASECAKKTNNYQVVAVKHYESLFQETTKTDVGYFNEWNTLPGVENGRKPMDTSLSDEELAFQQIISTNLRQILIAEKDLDEVTSKQIRTKLEAKMTLDLTTYKSFIDAEMMKILGQLDAPAKITDSLYLGTEWNASHQEDLFEKKIGCILNVTSEIDNFFPDSFHYMNIPVIDTEETNLLRYFNDSYRFINGAHKEGKNVLVHCKMGISRSATIVIAFVMKNKKWDLRRSLKHVQERRNCIRPNPNFMKQLEVYEGILNAKRFSNVLEKRSKSESNLKQSEFSLRTRKDSNALNSNGSLNAKRSPLKYYNTAPARLKKPDKYLRVEAGSSLCRTKSYSCATISMLNSSREDSSTEELVPRDVMDSFHNAVNNLEKFPPTSPKKVRSGLSLTTNNIPITLLPEPSLPSSSEAPIFSSLAPQLTRNAHSAPVFVSETLILPQVPSEPQMTQSVIQPPIEIYIEPAEPPSNTITQDSSISTDQIDFSSLAPNPAGGTESIQTWLSTSSATVTLDPTDNNDNSKFDKLEFDQSMNFNNFENSSALESRRNSNGKSNLKSCRHPFNGHTFSVSPNQVLNITSVADLKFSVRHLVNEFELYSNRKNFVPEASPSGFPLPVSLNSEFGARPIYKTWVNIDSTNGTSNNEMEQEPAIKSETQAIQDNEQPSFETSVEPIPVENVKETIVPINIMHQIEGEKSTVSEFSNNYSELETTSSNAQIHSQSQEVQSIESVQTDESIHGQAQKSNDTETLEQNNMPLPNLSSSPPSFSTVRTASGVVKQRLQAFEAKSVSDRHRTNSAAIMSHHRSQSGGSATTTSTHSTGTFPPLATPRHGNNQGHCKKLSLPQITPPIPATSTSSTSSNEPTSAESLKRLSPPIYSSTFLSHSYHSDRKGSLDSSSLTNFRTIPNRPVQVRGFASPTITSTNKITFPNAGKLRGGNASSSSGIKQEHGSTHPLKLLPQTAKLTQ